MANHNPLRQSPLVEQTDLVLSTGTANLTLAECDYGYINLRGNANDTVFQHAVSGVLDNSLALPVIPNSVASAPAQAPSERLRVCWLSPDEWLLLLPFEYAETVAEQLRTALAQASYGGAVNNLSSGQATIRVAGSQAQTVLAKGCSLDLHPRVFKRERCAQTVLAKVAILLTAPNANAYEITVRRSFADYLWRWLADASEEFEST